MKGKSKHQILVWVWSVLSMLQFLPGNSVSVDYDSSYFPGTDCHCVLQLLSHDTLWCQAAAGGRRIVRMMIIQERMFSKSHVRDTNQDVSWLMMRRGCLLCNVWRRMLSIWLKETGRSLLSTGLLVNWKGLLGSTSFAPSDAVSLKGWKVTDS